MQLVQLYLNQNISKISSYLHKIETKDEVQMYENMAYNGLIKVLRETHDGVCGSH